MSLKRITRWMFILVTAAAVGLPVLCATPAMAGEEDNSRKIKVKVQPSYPEVAKRMNLSGTVRIQVVVANNGSAKTIKPVGGNPVLLEAATEALKKWRWETGDETTEVVEFHFNRQD